MNAPPAPSPGDSYGSDHHGLVWGYLFRPEKPAQAVDSDTALRLLSDPQARGDGFLWLHFSLANRAAERWLREDSALPEMFREALAAPIHSTRLDQSGTALVAVLNDVPFDFSFDPGSIATVHLCVLPHALISARLHPLRSVEELRTAVKEGDAFHSTGELLARLLRGQAEVLGGIVRQVAERVDGIEDELLARHLTMRRRALGDQRRLLVRLQRLLAPEPAALFRLLNRPPGWLGSGDLNALRQAAEEFSTTIADAATLVERIKILQEEVAANVLEQSNRTLSMLTIVTVLALPINIMASLFGMNVGGIPLAESRHGFLLVVCALLAITATLAYLAFGRRRE